jgi:hypothetical protein
MPNEFKVKNGLIVDQGGATITGSLIATNITPTNITTNYFPKKSGTFLTSSVLNSSDDTDLNWGPPSITPTTPNARTIYIWGLNYAQFALRVSGSSANTGYLMQVRPGGGFSFSNIVYNQQIFSINSDTAVEALTILGAAGNIGMGRNGGNVGINWPNTYTIPTKFYVSGSSRFDGAVTINGTGTTSATTALSVRNVNASASLVVLDNGQVGIGTTTPSASILLDVSGSIRATAIVPTTDLTHNIGTTALRYNGVFSRVLSAHTSTLDLIGFNIRLMDFAGVTRAMLSSSNNFLIGTTTDAGYRLDVSGSTRITNNLTVTGSLITSGSIVVTGSLQVGVPGTSAVTIDTTVGTLGRGSSVSVDWPNRILYDSVGASSIDWESRTLYDPSNTFVALEYSSDAYLNSQLYYRNIIPGQVQRSISDTPTYGGQIIQATVDAGVVDYDLVFLDTDGTWKGTKAAVGYGADKMLGICVDQASGYVLIEGDIGVSSDDSQGAYVVGADHGLPVYASTSTGEMITTAPSGTGAIVRIVGHIYYQSPVNVDWWTMKFRPSNDWYEQ